MDRSIKLDATTHFTELPNFKVKGTPYGSMCIVSLQFKVETDISRFTYVHTH